MTVLRGRDDERAVLEGLLDAARAGRSGVLVMVGEAGIGKTALLDHAADSAPDLRIARIAGVESEMELPYAALHQLCGPMLDFLDRLPAPQRDALRTTFGMRVGAAPDQFMVGLAVLSLLSEVAAERPVLCVVDDAQWLDRASARALAFVARRLLAESVLIVFASRGPVPDLAGLPELTIEGLRDADARELLASVVRWPLDEAVRDEILAESWGNPLALLELPLGLSPTELAGGFGLPEALSLSGRIEESFLRRVVGLPETTRLLLVVAAADPVGDSALMWRAAQRLGLSLAAGDHAVAAGLLEIGGRVVFRHPLVRSAVYRAAPASDRRRAHLALAEATDPRVDPDRRAWHRARATLGRDEDVAGELEASAGRAQARGGLAAAAAFLERSAELSADPARQADRELASARAKYQAGAADTAVELLGRAAAGPPDELRQAGIGLLRGQMAFASGRSGEAATLLLETAAQLVRVAPALARETYLDALAAALYGGRFAGPVGLPAVAAAARAAPAAPGPAGPPDLLLDGIAVLFTDGYPAGAPLVRRAVREFRRNGLAVADSLRWLFVACRSAHDLWDDDAWLSLSTRYVQQARGAGALAVLPIALNQRIGMHLHAGELSAAAALVDELDVITEATGNPLPPYGTLAVAGWQGRATQASVLIRDAAATATARGEGMGLSLVHYTDAVLNNGLGRYAEALAAAELAGAYPEEAGFANWALAELVEAAARTGDQDRAAEALERLARTTGPSGTDWARGIEARSRALVGDGADAEADYQEAIDRLGRSRGLVALARARLVYGEWLRRQNRRVDARAQLRTAHEMFVSMGADAFARRTRRELLATGETVRKRSVPAPAELTPQERQIARRARDGQSNSEIGAELFLSARTVEWHLRKVFGKLGIASRKELRKALPEPGPIGLTA